ncbi:MULTISPECIES: hypothetical protein [Empedobacter]|uniref:hypothetical protein n=1 Tax=Empedobacter TaxID=59734 RepID=UPI00056F54F4|nr:MULTISPECIES: hypothetical protein [Empedobacter]MDM1042464.1 hypothetical protein [Empedobacter brevis]MDM1136342.1 hypothetical protein [Empedobacter sp. R750]
MKKFKSFFNNYILKGLFWIIIFGVISLLIIFFYQQNLNTSTYKSWIDGIISGVVTAIILFIIQVLWKKNLLVFIENLLYQDVKIEGEWNGFIVPFIGLDELDKMQKELAWSRFKEMRKKNSFKSEESLKPESKDNETNPMTTSATIYDEKTGKEEKVEAEIIYDKKNNSSNQSTKERSFISISAKPIVVRAELKRNGHKITGKIIEIGGASDIHTYEVNGTFKNLILTASYESSSENHIDRGALSLMLIQNGNLLEGFFSSYNDNDHCMSPMKCYLYKRSSRTNDI